MALILTLVVKPVPRSSLLHILVHSLGGLVQCYDSRAGNVIGGGDWATNRLIPDLFRSVDHDQPLLIRSPDAIRPWQHVLEPISGYITLAERLFSDGDQFSSLELRP